MRVQVLVKIWISGWRGMLVTRRLLIVAVLTASIGHYPAAATTGNKIGGMWWWWRPPWFISYLGFALIFHSTPGVASYHIAVTTSSSSSHKTDIATAGCRLSEFRCDNSHCIAEDKFCDGEDDCSDKSDEPKYCTRNYHHNYNYCYCWLCNHPAGYLDPGH